MSVKCSVYAHPRVSLHQHRALIYPEQSVQADATVSNTGFFMSEISLLTKVILTCSIPEKNKTKCTYLNPMSTVGGD